MSDLKKLKGHTAGPWFIVIGDEVSVRDGYGNRIAILWNMKGALSMGAPLDRAELVGNASLIASAPELLERVKLVEAENDKLRAALADKVNAETLLTSLTVANGGFTTTLEGGACSLLAQSFGQQFRDLGGVNFVELKFHVDEGLDLSVVMQKVDGKTPAQLLAEATARAKLAEAEVARLTGEKQ